MAMMPTTRRGRYLFYRERCRKRLRRLKARKRRPGGLLRRRYGRERDLSGIVKQSDVGRPREVQAPTPPFPGLYWQYIPPSVDPPRYPLWVKTELGRIVFPDSRHGADVGVIKRRRLRVPRLKHLPLVPYPGPPRDPPWWNPD